MPSKDWKNQGRPPVGPSRMKAFRWPVALDEAVGALARKHNTTGAAIERYAVEEFVEKNTPAPKAGKLFD